MDLNVPIDLLYTNDHTWLLKEDDVCTIGITEFGQSELSEIVFVEMPEPGAAVVQGEAFGTVEAMKTVAELISPVSGEVVEVNETLEADPRQVNIDPYGDGWIIKARLHDSAELENLLTPSDYSEFVNGVKDGD